MKYDFSDFENKKKYDFSDFHEQQKPEQQSIGIQLLKAGLNPAQFIGEKLSETDPQTALEGIS